MSALVIAAPGAEPPVSALAALLHAQAGSVAWRRFPDGESYLRLQDDPAGRDVIVFATLREPDAQALPLRWLAETARELGARRIGLVAPYLPYMRQDRRFHPGEAVSARLFARFLSQSFDWLVTVDPHLHRLVSLSEVYPIATQVVASAPSIARWILAGVPRRRSAWACTRCSRPGRCRHCRRPACNAW